MPSFPQFAANIPLAFGFGASGMLWFLAGASAPFLIHLWNKRRYRELDWAAMDYLLAALKSNSRKLLVEQWVLLAMRMLAVGLLAIAVAQPFWESMGLSFEPGERTHRLIVVDASYSMDFQPGDTSRFARAKELASAIVRNSQEGDGFTLILLGQPPQAVISTPAYARETVLQEIEELTHPQAGGDLPATLLRVEQVLQQARREHPKLVREEVDWITDLGVQTWNPRFASPEMEADFHHRLEQIANQSAMVILDVGQQAGGNLAITNFTSTAAAPVVGRDVEFLAQAENFSRQARARVVLEFLVDGTRADQVIVDLPASGAVDLPPFRHRFSSPGEHRVEIRAPADSLPPDDRRYLSVPVRDAFRVLCIDGKPSGVPFESETDYLQAALQSSAAGGGAPIDVSVRSELALLQQNLSDYDAIFLCNVRRFREAEATQLRQFVERGGGLITFLGDQIVPDNYNQVLGNPAQPVLPARIGPLIEHDPAETEELDPQGYRHPLLDPFRNNEQVALDRTPVYKYYQLAPHSDEGVQVPLTFAGGNPLVAEQRIGRGYSLLVATSASAGPREDLWTAMPMLQNYLPLVRQMLAVSLRGQLAQRNVLVGDPLSGIALTAQADSKIAIETPGGELQEVRLRADGDLVTWSFPQTNVAGFYRATPSGSDAAGGLFAVNLSTAESDPARVSPEELQAGLLSGIRCRVETELPEPGEQPLREIMQRGELHRGLLVAALLMFLGEMLLAWRLRSEA